MNKETYEWCRTWADHANATDLPRVLLVGDSITNGYQTEVRRLLDGICYVDMIATSYFVDCPTYHSIHTALYRDLPYAVVHFNHGLHGVHGSTEVYETGVESILKELGSASKLILATSTSVKQRESEEYNEKTMEMVKERNEALFRIAERLGCPVNDLFTVSLSVPSAYRSKDGVHYTEDGYAEYFAPRVAEQILSALNR